ncbi:2-phosphoglycerate kinase [Methanocaldococcus lauensis]|uniref:2-phosphoglycerate kinase n=1 Tax=Methanocaldococcus lauensis TaxID=2546128 RepID=A0A8D6Q1X9_9EURY|nr:2-phosphoglycerate kinase [Methanocaldococcus lauensis]CAB3288755.1 2-phosphoglycerate kinase [Methanocaldococcus lauensis]CAB3289732.1 2-phosphoglycerate kinase [Methanocaldococcus lauensis]
MDLQNDIVVRGKSYEMPFSKGILARSLMAAGLKPSIAYRIAWDIYEMLKKENIKVIDKAELRRRVYYYLISKNYDEVAKKYLLWRMVLGRRPIVILIGGASGVGTSTIAFEIASRLGISSVIGTDSIREVMRKVISRDLIPTLYESSYTAWKVLKDNYEEDNKTKYIKGFERHSEAVLTGVEGVINRCLLEGQSVIIEGTHLVPTLLKDNYLENPHIIFIMLTIYDEKLHKMRFYARGRVSSRPTERYLRYFKIIRIINEYMVETAKKKGVPVIENIKISETVDKCLNIITERLKNMIELEGLSEEDMLESV